ncbi:hypothetical protein ACFVT5_12275 [Streptomyces sp. NPDC058001]|uniref:hypothetical protein n=1 Tax=Streptomyces sp. NPDC058001 TaxID=3346300 RepID=UPI0036E6D69A
MRAGPGLRVAHTAVLAAVCLVLSGLGHALSSGMSPSPWAYAVALPPLCAGGWLLTRTERSASVVVSFCAVVQVALHGLYGLVAHHGSSAHSGTRPGHGSHLMAPGMTHGSAHPPPSDSPADSLADSPGEVPTEVPASLADVLDGLTPGMTAAHLVAGAVCGWWLWRGERALRQLARALRLFAGAPLRLVGARLRFARAVLGAVLGGAYSGPPPAAPVPVRDRRPARLPASVALLRAVPRRGPPLLPS